jgi:hypothetical protein
MTAQGSALTRFRRAVAHRDLLGAETTLREMAVVDLLDALDYVALLGELRPERMERAAVRWHARLEAEAPLLTLADSQLALAALTSLRGGDGDAAEILRRLVRRTRSALPLRARWPQARNH